MNRRREHETPLHQFETGVICRPLSARPLIGRNDTRRPSSGGRVSSRTYSRLVAAACSCAAMAAACPALAAPSGLQALIEPLATGGATIIKSDFKSGNHDNFEVLVLQGSNLVHYWHDNSNVDFVWHQGQTVSALATAVGPCSLIQSDFHGGPHGNFEAVVQEGTNLVHYFHDNSDTTLPWQRGQVIATGVTGPGAIIQSNFGSGSHGNFEVVVPQGQNLVHFFHDNSDVNLPWRQGQIVAAGVTGPACIIQSNFGSGSHGNFEVVVPQGQNLVHFFHDNSDVNLPWQQGQIVATSVTGPGAIIQSDFISGNHGDFEVVVPQGQSLVHFFHDNSDVNLPWQQGQIVATGVSGPGAIIQSDFISGSHGNFEVVVPGGRAPVPRDAIVAGGGALDQDLVHYFHDNSDVTLPWQRAQTITFRGRSEKVCQLTGDFDIEQARPTTSLTLTNYGLGAGDLGYPVENGDRITFLFGDSRRDSQKPPDNHPAEGPPDDSIGFTTDRTPPNRDQCLHLIVNSSGPPAPTFLPPVVSPAIDQGFFNVPTSGFVTPAGLYSFFWTDHCSVSHCTGTQCTCDTSSNDDPAANIIGRDVLARSSDGGLTFAQVLNVPFPFVYTASLNTDSVTGLPPGQQQSVLVYGAPCYRASTPYLAVVPAGSVEDLASWQYFSGESGGTPSFSSSPSDAIPVFDAASEKLHDPTACTGARGATNVGCVGEMSVAFDSPLQKWVMLYNCFDPGGGNDIEGGVRVRLADAPWGPWSDPTVLFSADNVRTDDSVGDHGLCHFMHLSGTDCDNLGGDNGDLTGGPYAPFILPRFSNVGVSGADGVGTRIFYAMSTWNPYQVVVMRSNLFLPTLPGTVGAMRAIGQITIGDRSTLVLPNGGFAGIAAGGAVDLGVGTAVGAVQALGPINLSNGARVNGMATSAGAITLSPGSEVSGGTAAFTTVMLPATPVVDGTFPPSSGGDVDLEPGLSASLAPGAYGQVAVKSRSMLRLAAGVYTFQSFDLEPQAELSLDGTAGNITIKVRDTIVVRGEIGPAPAPAKPSPFLLAYFGTADAFLETGFAGSVYAPNANLVLGASPQATFTGQYFAKTVTTRPDTIVVF